MDVTPCFLNFPCTPEHIDGIHRRDSPEQVSIHRSRIGPRPRDFGAKVGVPVTLALAKAPLKPSPSSNWRCEVWLPFSVTKGRRHVPFPSLAILR